MSDQATNDKAKLGSVNHKMVKPDMSDCSSSSNCSGVNAELSSMSECAVKVSPCFLKYNIYNTRNNDYNHNNDGNNQVLNKVDKKKWYLR